MRAINLAATKVMNKLVAMAKANGGHVKIDNGGKGIMAVCVELVSVAGQPERYSVSHYWEQNGDLMADPEMEFHVHGGRYYPVTFNQAPQFYQKAVEEWDAAGEPVRYRRRIQREMAEFAGRWMLNIKEQQFSGRGEHAYVPAPDSVANDAKLAG